MKFVKRLSIPLLLFCLSLFLYKYVLSIPPTERTLVRLIGRDVPKSSRIRVCGTRLDSLQTMLLTDDREVLANWLAKAGFYPMEPNLEKYAMPVLIHGAQMCTPDAVLSPTAGKSWSVMQVDVRNEQYSIYAVVAPTGERVVIIIQKS
jgi:hypothetical protein